MLQVQNISNDFNNGFLSNEINRVFEPEKRKYLIKTFGYFDNRINEHTESINIIKEKFEEYKNRENDLKVEIKKDLLVEIATKADIKELNGKIDSIYLKLNGKIDSNFNMLNGKIDSNFNMLNGKIDSNYLKLNGRIDTLESKFIGEFKSVKLWMKMLIGVALIGITFFSPTTQSLIKMLKF